MYEQIASNKRKTALLIFLFTILLVALGWAFGIYFDSPYQGVAIAFGVSIFMTLTGYFKGDAIALGTAHAKLIEKNKAPEVWRIIENLSIASGMPMPRVYIIDDPSPNAFATGRKPEVASIAITTGLLAVLEKNELEGVISHELSHIKNYDIRVMTIVIVLAGSIMLLADIFLRGSNIGKNRERNVAGPLIIIGFALAILSPLLAQLIRFAVSRSREYLADASAAMLTRYPDGLARALEKIEQADLPMRNANHATAHLYIANPFAKHSDKITSLFSTHPPIRERIARLRNMAK
ncbi:MAG: hypothetical protein ACD_76C00041G0007 [uncultured bacterium]|nr:MAG: hypothetical protein ACD_76C00041G0007 [uncultured bacterium]HBD05451.1 zinc metalloprotease HtpX [Candidatus Uhrbacteria bacterium]